MKASRLALAGIVLIAFAGVLLPVDAQQPSAHRIGVILPGGAYSPAVDGLRAGLGELGLEDGKQVLLSVRDAKGDMKSAEAAARTLERRLT